MSNELLLINPRKRRRKKTTRVRRRTTTMRVTNPRRKRRRSYRPRARSYRRHNPRALTMRRAFGRGGLGNVLQDAVIPSFTAAGGALALDVLFGFLPIPANLKIGPMKPLVKGVGAIGMGMLAAMFVPASTAKMFTTGALTVVLHDTLKDMMGRFMPNIPLGNMGYEWSGYNPEMGEYLPAGFPDYTGMGMYLDPPAPEPIPAGDTVGEGYNYY